MAVTRRLSPAEAAELLELDARLERLKIGIGGAVITLAWAAAGTRDRAEAEARIEASTGEAVAVRLRILRLRGPEPAEAPAEAPAPAGGPGEWPPRPGAPPVVVAAATPSRAAVARHVNVYTVSASSPRH